MLMLYAICYLIMSYLCCVCKVIDMTSLGASSLYEGSVTTSFIIDRIIDRVTISESITMPIYMYVGAYDACMCV